MPERLLMIVNPAAGGGESGRRWQRLEPRLRCILPPFEVAFTERAGHAEALAREGARCHDVVVAVGGDGSVNEVVNGLMCGGRPLRPDVALGMLPLGTGADFIRTFRISHDPLRAAQRLARGRRRMVDVGVARFGARGKSERYFINEAEAGMGAAVCAAVNAGPKGQDAYLQAIILTALQFQPREMTLRLDGAPPRRVLLDNVWISNGRWSGAGIKSAPRAVPDDGLLDVVAVAPTPPGQEGPEQLARLRDGTFVDLPWVSYFTARRVEIRSAGDTPIETDGDPVGSLPAVFEVCPERLAVIV